MNDSHDHDWMYDPDSNYNRQENLKLRRLTDYDELYAIEADIERALYGEDQYQISLTDKKNYK